MRGLKIIALVVFLCVSIAVTTIGVKNLFAEEYVTCMEAEQGRCQCEWCGCQPLSPPSFMACLIFGCHDGPFDCLCCCWGIC